MLVGGGLCCLGIGFVGEEVFEHCEDLVVAPQWLVLTPPDYGCYERLVDKGLVDGAGNVVVMCESIISRLS